MSAAPINKVAEAQARRKMKQMKDWKKKRSAITSIAESSEMTEASKKRAIEKMYRNKKNKDGPKKYVVATKGTAGSGGKNTYSTKFVDQRTRCDMKSEKRAASGKYKSRTKSKQSKSKKRR